jgi:NTP pyrophosphatase (non-canonical NTP hydrolase)
MTTTNSKLAAELAAFYFGDKAPVQPEPVQETVRGGLYSPAEQAATHAAMERTGLPTWQDLEARGVPFDNWPQQMQDRFLSDQESGNFVPPVLPHTDTAILNGIIPGTWQDFEARNVPYESWPEGIKEKFLYDQEHPEQHQPSANAINTYNAKTAYAAQATEVGQAADARSAINDLATDIFNANVEAGWWTDIKTGETLLGKDQFGRDRRNVGELLCLVHSEVSEAMEGYRKNLMDDKLPHRPMLEVELADAIIRILDIAGAHQLDLGGAIVEKRAYNASRADHKIENRQQANGKKF